MPTITLIAGLLLVITGVIGYFATGMVSITALIPAFIGVVIELLGLLSLQKELRKHAMHAVAALALLCALAVMVMAVPKTIDWIGGTPPARPAAVVSQLVTGVILLVLEVLCVMSFINARKIRRAATPE